MVYFQTKNPNFGKFWMAGDWKLLIYFMANWNILQTFGIFYDHKEHFGYIWYIFSDFGIMYNENSGNPGRGHAKDFLLKEEKNSLFAELIKKCSFESRMH
jgi:hypothetical protein